MRLLIVDNYDSFTFNLYQLAAEVFPATPVVMKNDDPWQGVCNGDFDAAIISPGPGRPDNARDFGISRRLLLETAMPVLGVCLGHQGIWQSCGGSIGHAPEPMHGRLSDVYHDGAGLFLNLPSPFRAVRYHSLICEGSRPDELLEIAWTADGLNMGVEHRTKPIWGVQFHPESICTQYGRELMLNFRRLAEAAAGTGISPASTAEAVAAKRGAETARLVVRKAAMRMDDEEIFARLFANRPYAFWLDSSSPDGDRARFSFMGGYSEKDASVIRYSVADGGAQDPLELAAARLEEMRADGRELPFDFATGFVGYFGYEMKGLLCSRGRYAASTPDCYLLAVDRFVAIDHATRETYMVFRGPEPVANAWFESLEAELSGGSIPGHMIAGDGPAIGFSFALSEREYLDRIEDCLEHISDGESYEICLTNRLRAAGARVDPFEYYCALRRRNPAPYSAFLRYPELAVACSSPERFLNISRDGSVESKPVKGTCERSANPEQDAALIERLRTDEKTRSENLMIVDLLRNDLGKVCAVGSVRVPKLMAIESFATVHQMVSTITGQLRGDRNAIDCIRACFPGGSMTGAPKLRAMEIIDSLETEARGVYSGSIGFLSANGAADLNIVIRSAVFRGDEVTIGAGGGIVALSDPAEEWQEVLLKARAPIEAFNGLKR